MPVNSAAGSRPSMRLRLENFRIFQDSGWFKLAPLTVLVGRNSSGKSSLLSALLLLKQSLERGVMGSAVMPLSLSGPYCDLGNYADVVHGHDESAEVSLSFAVEFSDLIRGFSRTRRPFVELAVPRPAPGRFGYYYYPYTEAKLPERGEAQARLTFSADEPFGPSLNRLEVDVTSAGAATFIRTISGERREHWRTYTSTLPPRSVALLGRLGGRTFFPFVESRSSSYARSSPKVRRRVRTFVTASQVLFRELQQCLTQSDVIGPFRTPPERRYPFAGFSVSRAGTSGEQAVNLLITEALLSPHGPRPLHKALAFWVNHLKLAESLDVRDIAKRLNLFEVDVTGAGGAATTNFADVGFGVSQVLPVLVDGLLMRPGGIYLVQQPEIHLHPDAQAGLADFFIYLSSYGVITVVETHSEYLLLRLRRRLAETARPFATGLAIERQEVAPLSRDDVAVLLTGSEGKGAVVNQLQIGEGFQFENLPEGFMSQALDDRLMLLTAVGKRDG
jgi:AAA domain, putative AbiEii toxin, Type IV TA system/AAA ATPase domain